MCRVLQVSRAGFYAWLGRPESERSRRDKRLRVEIAAVHRRSRRTYGSPRVHAELRARGMRVGRKRVARLMRESGLKGRKRSGKAPRTTDSAHSHPVAENLLQRRFSTEHVGGLDRVWAADITYLPTREGWLYLAIVLDLGSRRVVGWAMRSTLEQSLSTDALEMAIARRAPQRVGSGAGLLHHSDRGSHYSGSAYRSLLEEYGMSSSMSRKGDCWDNAVCESFFSTLETELIEGSSWETREVARAAVFEYIEVWYNRERLHSSLGYLSPMEYERRLLQQKLQQAA
jgi:transposase InsO family protein